MNVITLGIGQSIVAHGVYGDSPCLWFSKAKERGQVGEPADLDDMKDEVCIRFLTQESVLNHLERVRKMLEEFSIKD